MAKKGGNLVGSWAFTIGVLIAILLGLIGSSLGSAAMQWLTLLLFIVGVIVGVLNITSEEAMGFLTTSAILVFVSFAGSQSLQTLGTTWIVGALVNIFNALMVLFVPATIVVALRAVFTLARD
jgi:hypothetical protein